MDGPPSDEFRRFTDTSWLMRPQIEAVALFESRRLEIIAAVRALRAHSTIPSAYEDDRDLQHVRLMSYVLRHGADDLLTQDIGWAYRQGLREGASSVELRTWLENWREAIELVLGRRGAMIAAAYDQVLHKHEEFVKLANAAVNAEVVLPETNSDLAKDAFLVALVHHDASKCRQLARNAVVDLASYVDFCLDVAQPSLYDIGRLWDAGVLSVADEHAATLIAERALLGLLPDSATPSNATELHRHIVLACPEGERHSLGLQFVADALAGAGWTVMLLGQDTPSDALLAALRKERPFVLGLSVTMPSNLGSLWNTITDVTLELGEQAPFVLVGGWALRNRPHEWKQLGADAFAQDVAEALDVVDRLWRTAGENRKHDSRG